MFYLSLARELRMTVSQLLAATTAEDLAEWRDYFAIINRRDEPTVEDKLQAAFGGRKSG